MCSVTAADTGVRASSALGNMLVPPEEVKGIKKLDKSVFDKRVRLPAVSIDANSSIVGSINILKAYQLKLMKLPPVQDVKLDESGDNAVKKIVLLDPNLVVDFNSFDEPVKIKLKEMNVTESNFHYVERTITFDNWSIEDIIRAVLPEDLKFSGYSIIGHIAHFNLRNELLDYKYVLGEIVLNKVKHVRTVVNKVNVIENTYRNFQMELICGENDMTTRLRENACTFELDFSKVYWNSRLGTEHERVVRLLSKNDVLYDVFAGIGPFVVPAAKKGCDVLANDLNPDAYQWLIRNLKVNKVTKNVMCFNCDAKYFITVHLKNHLLNLKAYKGTDDFKVHITMNLPGSAVGFLHDFRGLFTEDEYKSVPKSVICHLYCFVKVDNLDKLDDAQVAGLAKELAETHLQRKFTDNLIEIFNVRKVAPTKSMFRVSFLFEPDFLIRKSVKRQFNEDCESVLVNEKWDYKEEIVMGKPQKGSKPSKNVFKVAGSRSFKTKNKAKAVVTQLKNLSEVNRRKTAEVDRQLDLLQEEVRQQGKDKGGTVKNKSTDCSRLISKDINQFEECEQKSAETLEKLSDMSM